MKEILLKKVNTSYIKHTLNNEKFINFIGSIIINLNRRKAVYKILSLLYKDNLSYSFSELQDILGFKKDRLYRTLNLLKKNGVISSKDLNVDETGKPQNRLSRYSINKIKSRAFLLLFTIKVVQLHSKQHKKMMKEITSK